MSLNAAKIWTHKQKLFIPVTNFSGYAPRFYVQSTPDIGTNMEVGFSANTDAGAFVGGTGITGEHFIAGSDAPNRLVSAGAGHAVLREVSSFGMVGLLMSAAADDVRHMMVIPTDWDRRQPIQVRVIYVTASATVADTVTWKFLYDLLVPNSTVMEAPATALDTVLVQEAVTGVANTIERTNVAGVIAKGDLGTTALYWSFLVELDAIAGGLSEDVHLLGIEFEFSVRSGKGHRVAQANEWTA